MKIVRITEFSQELFDAVERLLKQLSPDLTGFTPDKLLNVLNSGNSHLLILYEDNGYEIVGMLTLGFYHTPSGSKSWIEDVVVDNTCRGKGYGKQLVGFALEYAHMAGIGSVTLTSNPSRVAANNLYRALSFEQYHTNVYRKKW